MEISVKHIVETCLYMQKGRCPWLTSGLRKNLVCALCSREVSPQMVCSIANTEGGKRRNCQGLGGDCAEEKCYQAIKSK